MVKLPPKPLINKKNLSNTLLEYKPTPKKSVQQLNKEHYQKNKAKIKEQQRERYQQQKELAEQQDNQQLSKYYKAEAIKILMSLKEYTELNPQKHKLWLDFNWTLKDCAEDIQEGLGNIEAIMKLREEADKLINDYWETAKNEQKQKGKSWNSLDYDQQQRLIRYWGYEKARIENNYLDTAEQLKKQSQEYLKEIELAKFHEQRGKKGCKCYQCEEQKKIQGEIKQKWKKELEDYDQEQETKEECPNCGRMVKELDEENGVCKRCMERYKE
jgi:hypothetical protein